MDRLAGHIGGLRTDDDESDADPKLRTRHVASSGLARSVIVQHWCSHKLDGTVSTCIDETDRMPDSCPWKILLMNGGSSSGKTTLATSMQAELAGTWLRLNVDTFIDAIGPHQVKLLLPEDDGVITVTPEFTRLEDAWMAGIASVARNGANVLIEDGFLSGVKSQKRWTDALAGLAVFWVGVICDEPTTTQREQGRGDRSQGMASTQRLLVHRGIQYHAIVDTTDADPQELAARLVTTMRTTSFDVPPRLTLSTLENGPHERRTASPDETSSAI